MNSQQAAEVLISQVLERGYEGATRIVIGKLNRPPEGPGAVHWGDLAQWYSELEQTDQGRIRQLIGEAAREAVFGCLVVLDGASGGYPIPGTPSRYTVAIEVYTDTQMSNLEETIRVGDEFEDLHDRLLDHLSEIAPTNGSPAV